MTNYPITPPPELVQQWASVNGTHYEDLATLCGHIATQAARWGADQELEACFKWLDKQTLCGHHELIPSLRQCRRPKPPTLKEQALAILNDAHRGDLGDDEMATIRKALKALPND